MLAVSGQESGPPRSVAERRRMLAGLAERADQGPAAAVEARDLILPGPGGRMGARLYARPHASAALSRALWRQSFADRSTRRSKDRLHERIHTSHPLLHDEEGVGPSRPPNNSDRGQAVSASAAVRS